jgi:DNA replication protein DnaC
MSAARCSSPVTYRFDEWAEVLGSERLTGALLDRLTHQVHILEMNGDSYRLNQSKQRHRNSTAPQLL